MNGVSYFAYTQPDEPACVNKDFRQCGNVTADGASVAAALTRVVQHVLFPPAADAGAAGAAGAAAPPPWADVPLHELDWGQPRVRRAWELPRGQPSLECVGRRPTAPADPRDGRPAACVMLWKYVRQVSSDPK